MGTQENSSSSDFVFSFEENSPSTFADTIFETEPEFELYHDGGPTFIEPKIEVTVLNDDIDVDLNVNGAAWGESRASTSTTETGPGSDAAYEEFLLRYSPFVPIVRLTPQEIEDAAAGNFNFLNNSVRPLGRQLQLAARNQDDEDDEMEFNGEADASLLNSDATGSRFLDDFYEVNLNEEGHIVFKPNNIDHQNVDPPLDETSVVCILCKFVTDSKISLKNHMRIHSKALMCSHVDCFASFDFRPPFLRHYGVYHSPLKPFRCSYDDCYRAYETEYTLKLHYMDHSGEYSFQCKHENCTKEYKFKSHLNIHTSTAHSNGRPFKCPRNGCSKAFSIESRLNGHLRKHPAITHYICSNPHCMRKFRSPNSLKSHLQFKKGCYPGPGTGSTSTTSSRPFQCPYDGCYTSYKNEQTLKRHYIRYH